MKIKSTRSFLAAVLLCAAAFYFQAVVAQTQSDHKKMIELLKKIAEESKSTNPILGDFAAVSLRQQIKKAGANAPASQLIPLLAQLGEHELRLGNMDQGVEHLKRALMLTGDPSIDGQMPEENLILLHYRLGVALIQQAEIENRIKKQPAEWGILPFGKSAIYKNYEVSRQAIKHFEETLKMTGDNSPVAFRARWLMNLAYMRIGNYPDGVSAKYLIPAKLLESSEPFPRFENVAGQLGLDSSNLAGGTVADDFDNDGDFDLIVSTWKPDGQLNYYSNNGKGVFTLRTAEANLNGITGGMNLVQADYNNDGNLDLLVLRGAWLGRLGKHPLSLLHNSGNAKFTDVTFESGLGEAHWPSQTAGWADFDNDGDLDLYKGNEGSRDFKVPSQLFRNNGDGTFTDVAKEAGVLNERMAKSVSWGDIDGDNDPDLFISNLGAPNRLYMNNGDGTFIDVAKTDRIDRPIWSFPAWFWDYDQDGKLDLYIGTYDWTDGNLASVVADMLGKSSPSERPALLRGDGKGKFTDATASVKLNKLAMPMAANFGDLNHDGYPDFYLGTGYADFEGLMPNVMYINRGGKEFVDVTMAGGFGTIQKCQGVLFADLDRDGDQDVFAHMGGYFAGDQARNVLFKNPGSVNQWITLRLIGVNSNRAAIGARIKLTIRNSDGTSRNIYKDVNSGGPSGGNPLAQNIGLGKAAKIERIDILWPRTGKTQTVTDLPMNTTITIKEDGKLFTSP